MQNFILTENLRKGFRNTVVPINPESRFLTDTSSALLTVVNLVRSSMLLVYHRLRHRPETMED